MIPDHTGADRLAARRDRAARHRDKDIVAGVVAVPHGWGHKGTGGWRIANGAGGANVNQLMSSAPEDRGRPAGMAHLTGVPVRVDLASIKSVGQLRH
jgi:hypothetical protein